MTWNLSFTVAHFPVGWTGDYDQFSQEFVSLLSATLQGNIMPGLYSQTAFTLPSTDQGPIFMAGQWYYWSTSLNEYVLYNSQSVAYARSDNILDNADFQVNQRNPGLSQTPNIAAVSNTITPNSFANYLSDRWIAIQDGTLSTAPAQSVLSTAGVLGATDRPNTINCLRITAGSSAIATLSAAQFCVAMQRVTLQKARTIWDVNPSFSIWLRSSVVGTFCVFIQNAAASYSVVQPCAITLANTFQKFTFSAMQVVPYTNSGFGTNPTDWALTVGVCAGAGGNYQQSPAADGVWQAATRYCDSNQTNLLATANATLDMTLVQLEPASTVSAFQFKAFPDSLFACQYMFAKSMPYSVAPGAGSGAAAYLPNFFYANNTSQAYGTAKFPRTMRIPPTVGGFTGNSSGNNQTGIQLYNPFNGTKNVAVGPVNATVYFAATGVVNILDTEFTELDSAAAFSNAVSGSMLQGYSVDWTASVDL